MLICYSSCACLLCLLLIHVWLYYPKFNHYQDMTISFYSLNRIMAAWWHFQNSVHLEWYPHTWHHSCGPGKSALLIHQSLPKKRPEISKTTITGYFIWNTQEPFYLLQSKANNCYASAPPRCQVAAEHPNGASLTAFQHHEHPHPGPEAGAAATPLTPPQDMANS